MPKGYPWIDKTPEEEAEARAKRGKSISEAWGRKSPEEKATINGKRSKSNREIWESKTPEEQEVLRAQRIRGIVESWASRSPEEMAAFSIKMAKIVGVTWSNKSSEEKAAIRAKMSDSHNERWANMSEEEKNEQVRNTYNPQKEPTDSENFADFYQKERYSGEWKYNGCVPLEERIIIAGKIPDFINTNGKKAVIEILGWRHPEEDEEKLPKHYKKYGIECRIIWWYDCYSREELDRIFGGGVGD